MILSDIPRIFIEVKSIDEILDGNEGQLARYFNAIPSVTLGILTNGNEWRFYTDTGDPNIMDMQPFHIVRLDGADQGLDVLARFAKSVFSPESIRDYATELRYTAKIASFLRNELDIKDRDPSEYFVRWILKADNMYDGVVNANVVERFRPITRAALTRVIREIVRRSIMAMDQEAAPNVTDIKDTKQTLKENISADCPEENPEHSSNESRKSGIDTTERELEFFALVKSQFERSSLVNAKIFDAACKKDVPLSIAYKDTTGYFGIYFNKPSWWIVRAAIEVKKPWIGFNVDTETAQKLIPDGMVKLESHPYAEFRIQIENINDIDKLHRLLFAAFEFTINEKEKYRNEGKAIPVA